MALQSQKDKISQSRLVCSQDIDIESLGEVSLRPKMLQEYIGQTAMKQHIAISLESARIRKQPLDHVLLYGPPGLGKTTLANILAYEMHATLKQTSGPAIEKQADLISLLTTLQEGDILFIDEIHRIRPQLEEILYSAMEDFRLDIMLGSGTGAASVKIDIPPFTLIGATTKLSKISSPLRDRFGNILKLDFYTNEELSQIIGRSFSILGCEKPAEDICNIIAQKSRGTPRIANRFVRIVRDYQTVGKDVSSLDWLEGLFTSLGIDTLGLDILDRKLLQHLCIQFAKKPVGLSTLASILGEESDTIEDVIEPYLLKIGFIERTPRWRQITPAGMAHFEKYRTL